MNVWREQVENDFVKNINDTYTLNLAISILEDRESFKQENERLQDRINKAIETLKDEGLVVAIKIINEKNDEILLSSKDLLIDILKGSDKE